MQKNGIIEYTVDYTEICLTLSIGVNRLFYVFHSSRLLKGCAAPVHHSVGLFGSTASVWTSYMYQNFQTLINLNISRITSGNRFSQF